MSNHVKNYSEADKLTAEQKETIRKDFHEFSGGFHPGEAGEEHDRYLEDYEDTYGRDALDAFLTQWGEEESEKDTKKHVADQARKAKELKKQFHEIAKSCVTMNQWKNQVIVKVDDVTLHLEVHKSKTKAKAEWADCVWMLEKMLERGAKEFHEKGLLDPPKVER